MRTLPRKALILPTFLRVPGRCAPAKTQYNSAMSIEFRPAWLDADLERYRDTVERFVEHEMLPQDAAARVQGHVGHELWRRAGALGLLCSDVPEQYGGGGGDFRHEAVFYEAMARRGLSGMSASVHSIVAHYLLNHGTPAQRERYLPAMARGDLVGAIAMTEPDAGSDLQAIRTRAERRGERYRINGSKTFISNGYLAGLVLVVAKTDPSQRARGISIVIVETREAAGFRVGRMLDKIGMKAQDTAELFFDDVEVPEDNLLGGEPGQGFVQLMSDLPYERLMIGVIAVAAMEGAYRATLEHVRQRRAFGQAVAESRTPGSSWPRSPRRSRWRGPTSTVAWRTIWGDGWIPCRRRCASCGRRSSNAR